MSSRILDAGLIDKITSNSFSRDASVRDKAYRDFKIVIEATRMAKKNPNSPDSVSALTKAQEIQKYYRDASLTPRAISNLTTHSAVEHLAEPTTPTKVLRTSKQHSLYGIASIDPPSPQWLRAKPDHAKQAVHHATRLAETNTTSSASISTLVKATNVYHTSSMVPKARSAPKTTMVLTPSRFEWEGQVHSIGRAKPSIYPATPEHYWDINFPSEEEQIKRGEIIIATSPLFKRGSKKEIITTDTSGSGLSLRSQTPAQMSMPFKGPPTLQTSTAESVTSQIVTSSPNIPFVNPRVDENKQLEKKRAPKRRLTMRAPSGSGSSQLRQQSLKEFFIVSPKTPATSHQSSTVEYSLHKDVSYVEVSSDEDEPSEKRVPKAQITVSMLGNTPTGNKAKVSTIDLTPPMLSKSPPPLQSSAALDSETSPNIPLVDITTDEDEPPECAPERKLNMVEPFCSGLLDSAADDEYIKNEILSSNDSCSIVLSSNDESTLSENEKSEVCNTASSVRIAQQPRQREKLKRVLLCRKCAGHDLRVRTKAHGICPYSTCKCPKCESITQNRRLKKNFQTIRRQNIRRRMATVKASNKSTVPKPDIWDENTVYSYVLMDTNMSRPSNELQTIIYAGITMNPSKRLCEHHQRESPIFNYRKQHPTAVIQMVVIGKYVNYPEASDDEFVIMHMRGRLSLVSKFHPGIGAETNSPTVAFKKMDNSKNNTKRQCEIASCVNTAIETRNFVSKIYRVVCPTCGAQFSRASILNRHIETHTGQITKIQCPIRGCGGNVYEIYKHLRHVHEYSSSEADNMAKKAKDERRCQ